MNSVGDCFSSSVPRLDDFCFPTRYFPALIKIIKVWSCSLRSVGSEVDFNVLRKVGLGEGEKDFGLDGFGVDF